MQISNKLHACAYSPTQKMSTPEEEKPWQDVLDGYVFTVATESEHCPGSFVKYEFVLTTVHLSNGERAFTWPKKVLFQMGVKLFENTCVVNTFTCDVVNVKAAPCETTEDAIELYKNKIIGKWIPRYIAKYYIKNHGKLIEFAKNHDKEFEHGLTGHVGMGKGKHIHDINELSDDLSNWKRKYTKEMMEKVQKDNEK